MSNARNAPARRERRPDRGSTEKISVSLDREQEGREALVAWLGEAGEIAPEEREALREEQRGEAPKQR